MDVEEYSRGEINGEEANVTSLIHWCWSLLLTFESWMFVGQMSVHDNMQCLRDHEHKLMLYIEKGDILHFWSWITFQ